MIAVEWAFSSIFTKIFTFTSAPLLSVSTYLSTPSLFVTGSSLHLVGNGIFTDANSSGFSSKPTVMLRQFCSRGPKDESSLSSNRTRWFVLLGSPTCLALFLIISSEKSYPSTVLFPVRSWVPSQLSPLMGLRINLSHALDVVGLPRRWRYTVEGTCSGWSKFSNTGRENVGDLSVLSVITVQA